MSDDANKTPPAVAEKQDARAYLVTILRDKYRHYELMGEYDEGPKTLKLKRWPQGHAAELIPFSMEIIASVFSQFMNNGMNTGGGKLQLSLDALTDPALFKLLSKHAKQINLIIAKTLVLHKDNGFGVKDTAKTEDALDWVSDLETIDVIEIVKVLFSHNIEHLLKNALGLSLTDLVAETETANESQTKKSTESLQEITTQ